MPKERDYSPAATLAQVAELAGVAPKTATSVLLHGKGRPETARRVREAAQQLHYLSRKSSRLSERRILLLSPVDNSGSTYYLELMKIIREMLRLSGYRMIIENTGGNPILELTAINDAIRNNVVGAILTDPKCLPAGAEQLVDSNVATVVLGAPQNLVPTGVSSVLVDNSLGVYRAVKYLRVLGHERIAYLSGQSTAFAQEQRLAGFKSALEENGRIKEEYIVELHNSITGFDAGRDGAKRLLSLDQPPTAIIADDDTVAMGCLLAASQRRPPVLVPKHLSVIGHDDLDFAEYTTPSLSTVRIDRHRLGGTAVELLQELIDGGQPNSRIVTPGLLIRDTTDAP